MFRNTPEAKLIVSKAAINRNLGGHTSKRRLNYIQNDGTLVHLQSSYEIQYAEWLDKNNISWTRPNPLLWLDANNKQHRYYPDFYLVNLDVFIDTKNDYLIIKDQNKINAVRSQNAIQLKVLSKNELTWLPSF